MSNKKNLYDIIKAMSSPNSFERDMAEIQSFIVNHFRKKYLSKISEIINAEITSQKTDPPDDIRLLYALKPYARGPYKDFMDNIIEAAAAAKAIGNIKEAMPAYLGPVMAASVSSIKPDGIYDIDPKCSGIASQSESSCTYIIFVLILIALTANIS